MAIDLDAAEMILEQGVDMKNRRIYFGALSESSDVEGSDFSWRSCERAIRMIHILENEAPHKPIEIHMSSPGGDAYEMLRLIDIIEYSPCQFKFYGSGKIMSAATWVMAVCDERYLYRNARILLHDGPAGGSQDIASKEIDQRIEAAEGLRLQEILNKMFADNSRMPEDFFELIVKRDTYLSPEETVAIGLADKVLEPKKRGNLRRMRLALLNKEVDKAELGKTIKSIYNRINETRIPSKIEIHTAHDKSDSKVFVEKEEKEKPVELIVQPALNLPNALDQAEKSEP